MPHLQKNCKNTPLQLIPPFLSKSMKKRRIFSTPIARCLKTKDKEILIERCSDDVKKEMIKLRQEPPPEQFNSSYLKYLHQRLFSRAFEWAGQTREEPFTFADSSVVSIPILKRKEFTKPFAIGRKVQEGLEKLNKNTC